MTCVTLKVHIPDCPGQGQGEQHWQPGVKMATCLYMGFDQDQAEQQDKLGAHMDTFLFAFVL